jgi:hypothetical protein
MTKLFVAAILVLVSAQAAIAAPQVSSSELNGKYKGISGNGPCTIAFKNQGNLLASGPSYTVIYQNGVYTWSMLFSASSVAKSLSSCSASEESCDKELTQKVNHHAYDENSISFKAYRGNRGGRCLDVFVEDIDHSNITSKGGEWVGQNHCTIDLDNRKSGNGCIETQPDVTQVTCKGNLTNDTPVKLAIVSEQRFVNWPTQTIGHFALDIQNGMTMDYECARATDGWNCKGTYGDALGYTINIKKLNGKMTGEILQPPARKGDRLIGRLACTGN